MTASKYGPRTITTMRLPHDILSAMDVAAKTARTNRTDWMIKLLREHLGLESSLPAAQPTEPANIFD